MLLKLRRGSRFLVHSVRTAAEGNGRQRLRIEVSACAR